MDLLDWKNTQPLHQLQKKVTYSLNCTLGNCKKPGLNNGDFRVSYVTRGSWPSRVPTTTTTAPGKLKTSWYYLHVRHTFWSISVT